MTMPDSLAQNSMADGGQDDKLDQKSESPVPSSREYESTPPGETKFEPSPSVNQDGSSQDQVPETGRPDPRLESSGSTETPAVHDATKSDSSSLEKRRPPSRAPEERESSAEEGKIWEVEPESTPSIKMESETPEKSREEEELPAEEQQSSITSGTQEQLEESAPAVPSNEKVHTEETTEPAQENPALLTSLPPPRQSLLRRLTRRVPNDDELKEKVVIPQYLGNGIVSAIDSAGVAHPDFTRGDNVKVPECPILVFINSTSGGRLGPALEAQLVDLLSPSQVYDLSKCKPADVLRHGLGFLEKEAEAGDTSALETRNNLRIMVAGGDGTVGWVLGCIGDLGQKEGFKVPPVGVIPLGTGNDLSRSFRWGGGASSVKRSAVKRWLTRCVDAETANLDRWKLVVKPAPTRQDVHLELPHAMVPQHHIPLENPDGSKEETKNPYFEGSFWNYFSLGMDAQVAYGFHHLRHDAPWIASGRVANQMVYGGYSCYQGWFCAPCTTVPVLRGLRQIVKVHIKRSHDLDAQWEELELPANIRAIAILNLQSYAGGRNPWGSPSAEKREKKGFVEAKYDDGVLEIVGLRDAWHTAFVLLDWLTAVRLGQARAVKMELNGRAHRRQAYMQMDGEPWLQPLGAEDEPPAVVEINHCPVRSLCLLRK